MSPLRVQSKLAASKVAMSAVDEVMDKLKTMTLLEASELVKAIEETFDVDASASSGGGMMMMAPGAAAGGEAAAAVEEQTEFDLVLESFPADKKIAVLKVVRTITGLGLKEAKEMVEAAPKVLSAPPPCAALTP
jgi:large subunit ribosomal protein L7/L12